MRDTFFLFFAALSFACVSCSRALSKRVEDDNPCVVKFYY